MDPFAGDSDAQFVANPLKDYLRSFSPRNPFVEPLVHGFDNLRVSSPRIETPRFDIGDRALYPGYFIDGQRDDLDPWLYNGYDRASSLESNMLTRTGRVDRGTWYPRFHEYGSYPRLSGSSIVAEGISESNIYPALSRPALSGSNRMDFLGNLAAYPREVLRGNLNARRNTEIDTISLCNASIRDLRGKMRNLAKSPSGHKILLEKTKDMKPEEAEIVLGDLVKHIGELVVDPFANHVIQELVEACSDRQRAGILSAVTGDPRLIRICLDQYGSRVIKELLKGLIPNWQKREFVLAIYPGVVQLTKNSSGRHIVEHCLKDFPARYSELLLDRLADNFYEIATDQHGCHVMSQQIKNVKGESDDPVVAATALHALPLAQHCYGNYVVQDLLLIQQLSPQLLNDVHQQFTGSYSALSRNKFASNVMEKCLLAVKNRDFMQIVYELLEDDFPLLLSDEYANFVAQTMTVRSKVLGMPIHDILVDRIRASRPLIERSLYGRKALYNLANKHII